MDENAENYSEKAKKDDGSCTFSRDNFTGNYATSMTCVYEGDLIFNMEIKNGPNTNEVLLANFFNWGVDVLATVDGNNVSFKDTKDGVVFEGDGYISGSEISLDFEVCEAFYYPCSDPDYCSKTLVRK